MPGFSEVVCGPGGASGVTYAQIGGQQVSCGVDSAGHTLFVQVRTIDDQAADGSTTGLAVGGAMLLVMATAWVVRVLRAFIDSSGEA
ncbi:hypothetical protein [Trinickia fusca]|uniref:Uncharacterized protein n=1 Tax=Trinickia fusca TaxID=2419777 RepID=A0A494X9M8_9BURK|nr:hypothetical protein [Trinickia fusca]RKP46852.1 hypothetical protein D7S89_15960 [Trinickia fusca]